MNSAIENSFCDSVSNFKQLILSFKYEFFIENIDSQLHATTRDLCQD